MRRDWVYDVMLPVIAVSAVIGMAAGASIGWPEDWGNSAHRNAFWGWTASLALILGFTTYIATGVVGLLRRYREQ